MATQVMQAPAQSPCLEGVRRRFASQFASPFASRFNRLLAFAVAILVPAEIVLAKSVRLQGLPQLLDVWPALLMLTAALWYCRWRPLPKLIDFAEMTVWSVLLTNILSLLIQIAGRSNRPLQDRALAGIDARMHFETAFFVQLARQIPAFHAATYLVYASLPVLILAAILIPSLKGHADASRGYILGIVLSAVVTAALFALWPAAGPWTTENFSPAKDQAAVTAYLTLLHSHGPVVLDMKNGGIVSFPSFHVVLAILSAFALGSIRSLRAPAWILAILICVSTVLTGWHYGIDVLGGLAVAVVSIAVVRQIRL
jgi:membrane-associated phospholipid phosphatase